MPEKYYFECEPIPLEERHPIEIICESLDWYTTLVKCLECVPKIKNTGKWESIEMMIIMEKLYCTNMYHP